MTEIESEIYNAFEKLLEEGQIVELRALGVPANDGIRRTLNGFFDDPYMLARAAAALSNRGAKGVYFTPNPITESRKTKNLNTLVVGSKGKSATDSDITRQKWLLIDIDPERPTGVSATQEERFAASDVVYAVRDYLTEQGFPEPVFAESGNGFHLMYEIEGVTTKLVRDFLEHLASKFDTPRAKVDRLVFNPSRIWKVYGTTPCKGPNTNERPHRKARLLSFPEVLTPVSVQQLEGLTASGDEKAQDNVNFAQVAVVFDKLDSYLAKHFPQLKGPDDWPGKGRRWTFDVCPWDESHLDRSAYVLQFNDGGIAAGCLHKNCNGHPKDDEGKHVGWDKLQELAGEKFDGRVTPVAASTLDSPNLTDLGNAKRLVKVWQNELLYCPTHGSWYIFRDSHWERDMDGEVNRRAKAVVSTIFDEAAAAPGKAQRSAIRRHALRSESSRAINSMISLASTEIEMSLLSHRMDADPWLFNVANGTIDLRTGKLSDHDRTDYITKVSPVTYDPDAKCPLWDEFLSYAMEEDQEVIDFIHRFFGYCLTGLVTEQVLLFMEGTGSNGKTTALLMIMHLLGEYAIQGAPGLLLAKQGESHPTEVADLEGTRFVANSEVEKGKPFAEALIKQLTGSDPVRARRMRQDFYQFMPTHKLCIAANHRPIIKGNDEGIWRRVLRIPWNRQIPKHKKDPFFLDKLKAEAPGILAHLVRGCMEWQTNGLNPTEKVMLATGEYREEMDVLADFMEEVCLVDDEAKVPQKDLYLRYTEWCDELKQKPQNYRLFNRQLKERNFKLSSSRMGGRVVRAWNGIGIRPSESAGNVVTFRGLSG
tara:strand:+ start:2654 stop:5110 length:2457 start_codon:yes stop_codon:yes gene_type:complete